MVSLLAVFDELLLVGIWLFVVIEKLITFLPRMTATHIVKVQLELFNFLRCRVLSHVVRIGYNFQLLFGLLSNLLS